MTEASADLSASDGRLPVLFDRRSALSGRPGGWERVSAELAQRLNGVVTLTPRRRRPRAIELGWEWTALPIEARRHQLVHLVSYPPTPALRARLVWTVHDLTWWHHVALASPGGRVYYRRLAALALARAHLVTVSEAVAVELRSLGVPDSQVTVIPNGVRLADVSVPEQRERPYLLAVGTVEPRKNLPRLLAAYVASGLAGRVDLLLVGRRGWQAPPTGATYLGPVDDARLAALYAGARAVVSVSTYEGFGLPVAEAMCAGTPVVCSDLRVFHEVAGDEAAYVDPADDDAITTALRRAAAGDLPVPDAARARARFDWDRCAERHVALYRQLLDA